MQSHGKLCKETNKTSLQTAHLFIRVLASLHCNVGCPINGEEMRFTSWEEMVRDDHTPIPSESPAVNYTSASLLLQLTSEGALHVSWMSWKEWKQGGEDGGGVITEM